MLHSIISPAFAQEAPANPLAPQPPSPISGFVPLILIFVIFYFLIIRPQQKKMKQHEASVAALKVGEEVITGGGVYGKITKVEDATLMVEVANGVVIKVSKPTVTPVAKPTQPEAKK